MTFGFAQVAELTFRYAVLSRFASSAAAKRNVSSASMLVPFAINAETATDVGSAHFPL